MEGKLVMRFQSENAIFKFQQCSEGEAFSYFPKERKAIKTDRHNLLWRLCLAALVAGFVAVKYIYIIK